MQFDQLKRREFITLLGGAAVACPLAAHAQQANNARLGYLPACLNGFLMQHLALWGTVGVSSPT